MTAPPDDPTDQTSAGPTGEDAVDELAQRAGASLRRPAPADGAQHAAQAGRAIRRRRVSVVTAGAAVIALVAVLLVNRSGGTSTTRVDAATPTTLIVTPTVAAPTPTVASPGPTVASPTPTTAAPTATTVPFAATTSLDDRLNRWALDYVAGRAGGASGTPVRIGLGSVAPEASQAAVAYLNAELGGIGGRPVRLDACTWTDAAAATACGARFAADPSIPLVISSLDSDDFLSALGPDKPRFGGVVTTQEGRVSYGLQPAITSFVALAKVVRDHLPAGATKVAFFSSGPPVTQWVQPWLPGIDVIGINGSTASDGPGAVAALQAAGATDADGFIFVGLVTQCHALHDALAQLGSTAVVVANLCSDRFEGWYDVTVAYNPDDPSYESGAATGVAKLAQYGFVPDPGDFFLDRLFDFADILTAAKIINGIGGPDAATPDVLRQALTDFKGPAMLTGDQDCSLMNRSRDTTLFPLPLSCQKTMNLLQVRNGKFVTLDPVDITKP